VKGETAVSFDKCKNKDCWGIALEGIGLCSGCHVASLKSRFAAAEAQLAMSHEANLALVEDFNRERIRAERAERERDEARGIISQIDAHAVATQRVRAEAAERELHETKVQAEARYDCHGGPGTASEACGACNACISRRAAALEAQLDTLATKEARCHETIRALEADRDRPLRAELMDDVAAAEEDARRHSR
jgi:hypothetical protein